MKYIIFIVPLFLVGCAHFSYESEDLLICLKKDSYVKEFCTLNYCEELDACGRVVRTWKK